MTCHSSHCCQNGKDMLFPWINASPDIAHMTLSPRHISYRLSHLRELKTGGSGTLASCFTAALTSPSSLVICSPKGFTMSLFLKLENAAPNWILIPTWS